MSDNNFSLTVYRRTTGEIESVTQHFCDGEHKALVLENIHNQWGKESYGIVESDDDTEIIAADTLLHYVTTIRGKPTIVGRPNISYEVDKTTIVADGIDYLTLTDLHDPCEIVIDDPDPTVETSVHVVTGGGFEFSADTPGLYTIEIRYFPFLPMTLEITAE